MNKTLIITGGSKGIGRSIAIKFAQNNFDRDDLASQWVKIIEKTYK